MLASYVSRCASSVCVILCTGTVTHAGGILLCHHITRHSLSNIAQQLLLQNARAPVHFSCSTSDASSTLFELLCGAQLCAANVLSMVVARGMMLLCVTISMLKVLHLNMQL